ncbi:MAG: type II secretion system F family protein [Lentisphaeria bacterium]|jgi:general secretion pathway protein F
MPQFKFRAADPEGRVADLLIEGDGEADALARLRARGCLPLQSLGPAENLATAGGFPWGRQSFDACDFTARLEPLLRAHIPLERALGILADGTERPADRQLVRDLRRGLHEGKKLSALIRGQGRRFPDFYANLIEAGEESGALTEVVGELRRFLGDRRELRDFLITSSIYPAILLSVTFGVIILLFTVFLPRFAKLFQTMGRPLPLPTRLLLGFGQTLSALWWLWLLLAIAAALFTAAVRRGGKPRAWWDAARLRLPLLGPLGRALEIARFFRTLAVLVRNHVHLLNSVRIAARTVGNLRIAASFAGIAAELRGGSKLSGALRKSPFVPATALQMLAIGEESGDLGGMLEQVATQYEAALRQRTKRLLALFEPAVILLLAAVVLMVVLSIFLAILEMNRI